MPLPDRGPHYTPALFAVKLVSFLRQRLLLGTKKEKSRKAFRDNEQKFAINLMHVRFSKDELHAANSLLSSPVYGWLSKQWSDLSPPLCSR